MRSLFNGVSGVLANQTRMDVAGNNLANSGTLGFKTSTPLSTSVFEQSVRDSSAAQPIGLSTGLGTQIVGVSRNYEQGALQRTNVPTDLSLEGDGFFVVNTGKADGTTHLTRSGNFTVDAEGYLRLPSGQYLMGEGTPIAGNTGVEGLPSTRIQIPSKLGSESVVNFSVGADGTVVVTGSGGTTKTVGMITVQRVANPNGLAHDGGNMYTNTLASGKTTHYSGGAGGAATLQSGALESSNLDMAKEFSNMILIQRAFEASAKSITTSDEMLQVASGLKR